MGDRLDGFRILTEYECGRAQIAIEWVARSQKPIVEIGGCPIKGCDFQALAHDLNRCIELSGETTRGFIIPDRIKGYCCYGFYRYPWAIKALFFAWGIGQAIKDTDRSLWLQGLVFGYSAEAIQGFISSASFSRASNSRSRLCSQIYRRRKVEIYGPLALTARRRSNRNDKCRATFQPSAAIMVSSAARRCCNFSSSSFGRCPAQPAATRRPRSRSPVRRSACWVTLAISLKARINRKLTATSAAA